MSVSSTGYTRESSPFSDQGSTSSGSFFSEPITPPPHNASHRSSMAASKRKGNKIEQQVLNRKKIPDMKKSSLPSTITFAVRESLFGRKGWMLMPHAAAGQSVGPDMRQIHQKDLEKIYDQLNSMELQGEEIPETITVKLSQR